MAFNNRSSQFGRFEPRSNDGRPSVMTSHERVKFRILELQYEAENAIEEMLKYKLCNKTMPFAIENCNVKILKIFLSIRPHIINYLDKEGSNVAKLKKESYRKKRLEELEKQREMLRFMDSVFNHFINGGKIKEDGISNAFNFLAQFVYDLGVTRIEAMDKDPIKDFSVGAYGEDLSDDDKD